MQRLKDYAGLGLWALGLSYIALVLLSGAHPETLPDAFQLFGLLAAIFVMIRLLLVAVRAARRPPKEPPPRKLRRPPATVMRIKARDHFGLRGLER